MSQRDFGNNLSCARQPGSRSWQDVLVLPSVEANSSHYRGIGWDCGEFEGLSGYSRVEKLK